MSSFGKGFERRDDDTVVSRELGGLVSSRELGLQGVSARPLAILPILPGSITTGSRSDTPPRQAQAGFRSGSRVPRDTRGAAAPATSEHAVGSPLALGMLIAASPAQIALTLPAGGSAHSKLRRYKVVNPTLVGERGSVPGAQAGAILPSSIGRIARGCAEGIGPRSTRAKISTQRTAGRPA